MNINDELERLKKRIEELEKRTEEQLPDNDVIYVAPKHKGKDLIAYSVSMRRNRDLGAYITLAHVSIAKYGSEEMARKTAIKVYDAIVKFTDNI